ncbi:phosphoribosylanthranilate isomerase [Siculibacillus lacustris]|uniref:N-(5'-phosphoribosyl)anthranilate isomerase n=1 Tax=Siculibacillus lacustris TaxID=1549641 RepID=A0A4Q9VXK8_9HYPH|nr:phosphoribosylanthranilate isomerase [Siculibacillus lacustris]TBW41222.1 phosphoribosylanthranilate isomerase [Siculibacillus lacustris]
MAIEVKICGLNTDEAVTAALEAKADFLGFVFYTRSPRHLPIAEAVRLAAAARGRARIVALTVDASDDFLSEIVDRLNPDLLQLHGRETPARAAEIRALTGVPVMKALAISEAADLAVVADYVASVDRFLFDAKPPRTPQALPGGNGVAFDWRLLAGLDPGRPHMLSGGLDPSNVARAIEISGVGAVDVSSGVEKMPGEKDPDLIRAFVRNARAARAASAPRRDP